MMNNNEIAMLAKDYREDKAVYPCYIEPKFDGVRVLAKVNGKENTVEFFFRSGKPVHTLEHLELPLLELVDGEEYYFDGEITSEDGFMKCVGDVRRKSKQAPHLTYNIFDGFHANLNANTTDYLHRKEKLKEMLEDSSDSLEYVHYRVCKNYLEVLAYKDVWETMDSNVEGVMVKANTMYQHKRTWDWMKIKDEQSVDFPIVDFYEGKGKYEGMLGGVIVENPLTNVRIRVGGGYNDSERTLIWNNREDYIGKTAEVKYQYMTPKGSLRHPIYKGVRIDK